MSSIRFFTDEDIHGYVAARLRAANFDALSTPEANRIGEVDVAQLTWAYQEGRVMVTFNVAHFARLHHEWLNQREHHAGIIVSQQRPVGDLLRRLLTIGRTFDAESMSDRLEYLSNWAPA